MNEWNLPSLWERLKHDVTFRVGTLYAGGSWFLVEALDTLQLPGPIVQRTAIVLAVLFLPVLGAVALWQRRRALAERAAAAAPHVRALPGLRRWGLALASVLVIATGLWAFGSRVIGDVPPAAERIAVIPFRATGADDVRELGVGMVDLLTAALGDVGPISTVASRTILARVGPDGSTLSLDDARAAARAVGAGSVLTGSITAFDDQANLVAELRDVLTGAVMATAEVRGSQNDMMALTDRLAVTLVRELWRSRTPMPTIRTAALTTEVPAALRSWLRGEQALRATRFDSAAHHFQAAIAADSTFALAYARLADAIGWVNEGDNTIVRQRELMDRAVSLGSRLPERERSLVRAYWLRLRGSFDAFDSLKAYVASYPDDPTGWYHLGDARYHAQFLGLFEEDEVIDPFLEASRLDPLFGLGLTHVVDIAIARGDRELYDATLPQYARFGDSVRVRRWHQRARVRWASADSLLPVLAAEFRSLRMPAERAIATGLLGVVGSRVRTDMDLDPALYEYAADTMVAVFSNDRDLRQAAFFRRRWLYSAMGRIDDWNREMEEQTRFDGGNPWFGPEITNALEHSALILAERLPHDLLDDDLLILEGGIAEHPELATQLTIVRAFTGRIGPSHPAIDSVAITPPPGFRALDTASISASLRGWLRIGAGDTIGGLAQMEAGVRRVGHVDADYIGVPWEVIGAYLTQRPGRERQGVLMMREHIRRYAPHTGSVYLDLARALERMGERDEAREAYAHALRFWNSADPEYYDARLQEIRAALARLSGEPAR